MNKNTEKKMQRQETVSKFLKRFDEDPTLVLHHKTLAFGAMRRTGECKVTPYQGKFGVGYKVETPCWSEDNSNKRHWLYYYIRI